MVTPVPADPRCPVTGCARTRGIRPLCNAHIRRVGRTLVTAYFDAVADPNRTSRNARLALLLPQMIDHAEAFDTIRATGLHPVWDTAAEQWVSPRDRARKVLAAFDTHRIDIDALVAALYPRKRVDK